MATISGNKTVTSAGISETLGSIIVNSPIIVKALTTNTGLVYIGNSGGSVSSSTGMPMAAGDVIIFNNVGSLRDIFVDSAVNGEGVAWISLDV